MPRLQLAVLACVIASSAPLQQAFAAPDAPALMKQMEGVYKERFESAFITPGKEPGKGDTPYAAENIIEIVPYDDQAVYFRAHLEFYNGHSCGLAGIARYEDGAFVYREKEPPLPGYEACTLRLSQQGSKLLMTDRTPAGGGTCWSYCGVNARLTDYSIEQSAKRRIRYLPRILGSRQYRHAVEAYRKQAPQ